MKKREQLSSGVDLSTFCRQLKLPSVDGKMYKTDAVNTENAFRIIQSVPSGKAEPFKRWLAKVGDDRIQETDAPELAGKRVRDLQSKLFTGRNSEGAFETAITDVRK